MQNIINIQSGSTPEQNVFRNVINDLEDNEAEWYFNKFFQKLFD